MSPRPTFTTIATSALTFPITLAAALALTTGGCADVDGPESTLRHVEAPTGMLELELEFPAADEGDSEASTASKIEAIVRSAEAVLGSEATEVNAEARLDDAGKVKLVLTLWGRDLPTPEAMVKALKSAHPELAQLDIDVRVGEGVPNSSAILEAQGLGTTLESVEDEAPEELRARITEELRAKGVEGEIEIEIDDDDEGERRVEVRVENTDDEWSPGEVGREG